VSRLTGYAAAVRSWLAFLGTMLGLVACTDHGAGTLAEIKAEVCACTTASCAERAMANVSQRTIASNHRTQAIARDMLDCFAKLQDSERPSTDPDEENAVDPAAPPASAEPPAATPTPAAPPASAPASAAKH